MKKIRYRKKETEHGLIATGDRERAEKDGARYVDTKRFSATPTLKKKPKKKAEEDDS